MSPSNLKFYSLFVEFTNKRADMLSGKSTNSKKFNKTGSDINDYQHLHALILCDYVTCDSQNKSILDECSQIVGVQYSNLKTFEEVLKIFEP